MLDMDKVAAHIARLVKERGYRGPTDPIEYLYQRRCLADVGGTLEVPIREVYSDHPIEGETWPVKGDHIDAEPLLRETVLLSLPVAPVCDEACAGLCPTCGADRNVDPCGCDADVRDDRWAVLDQLELEDE